MKKFIIIISLILPVLVTQAVSKCTKLGTTVVFVNGMNAVDENIIEEQSQKLGKAYSSRFPDAVLQKFTYAFNPSRGEGMDLVESIMQSCSADNDVGDINLVPSRYLPYSCYSYMLQV